MGPNRLSAATVVVQRNPLRLTGARRSSSQQTGCPAERILYRGMSTSDVPHASTVIIYIICLPGLTHTRTHIHTLARWWEPPRNQVLSRRSLSLMCRPDQLPAEIHIQGKSRRYRRNGFMFTLITSYYYY